MGFLWVTGFSFFHCVASPFHSFVTTMDMISHMFTLSVITDEFGQTAQSYMARTDHHCESVVQPFLNHLTCMQTRFTSPMHHCMMSTNLYSPWPKAQTATHPLKCYTEKAPNAWQCRGTQKTKNTYNQPNRPNRQTSRTKHQALLYRLGGARHQEWQMASPGCTACL